MTSERSYSRALSEDEALDECRRCAGEQSCDRAADALGRLVESGRTPVVAGCLSEA